MKDLFIVIGAGFIGGMLSLILRKERPEFSVLIALMTSAVIVFEISGYIERIISELKAVIESCGVDIKYFTVIIKSVGVAYVTQFAAEILRDSGENAIASKVESGGKICILAFAMPVMTSFLELCTKVVNGL